MQRMHCDVYDRVGSVPEGDWRAVVGEEGGLAVDRRLIALQERVLAGQCRIWTIVVRAGEEAMGVACVARFDLDAMRVARWMEGAVGGVRRVWPGFLRNRVVFVGLPLPCGSSQLRVRAGVDATAVVQALEQRVQQLARDERAGYVVWKEFDAEAEAAVEKLAGLGYVRGTLPAMHRMEVRYRDFGEYLGAVKSRYRNQITRSQKKFKAAGLRVVHVTAGGEIARRMTGAVHGLYAAVYEKSHTKLELLPVAFFREVAEALPGQVSMTFVEDGAGKVAGWTLGIRSGEVHYNVYSGVDYAVNESGHVYFNLFYHDLDYAFRSGARVVHLGETSDGFKSRLGTEPVGLHCYVRPRNVVVRMVVRRFAGRIFPEQRLERHEVFK